MISVNTASSVAPAVAYHIVERIRQHPYPNDVLFAIEFLGYAVPFMLGPAATVGSGDLPVFTTIEIRWAPLVQRVYPCGPRAS